MSRGLIIIGPGDAFGIELIERFNREGFSIGLIGRSEERLSDITKSVPYHISYACADVRDEWALGQALQSLNERMGNIECVIYNVKHSPKGSALTLSPRELIKALAINLEGFWSKQLAGITEKRNRQMRDAVNKAAKTVVNHCLENCIGRIVFGWNQGQKDGANMGRKTNQKFVQIPTARLKARIAQLCEQYGIEFVETEEAYTSKASFVDGDSLPKHGEKPEAWKSSGKRVKRGLFRSANNLYINADCNGAANIIRKVAATFGLNLGGVSRGALITPLRVRLWPAQESPSL